MVWLASTLAYVAAHFAMYALLLRHWPRFSEERTIFLYHLLSEVGWPVLLGVGALTGLWPGEGLAAWIGVLSLHGIYSLTFLSLWSLASGSYSIGILQYAQTLGGSGVRLESQPLEQIGAGKQDSRLRGIERLGLLERQRGGFALTGRGRWVARLLATIAWTLNVREGG